MMINGPWQLPFLATEAPDLEYEVAPLPEGKDAATVLGGENYMLIDGPNVDAAWDLLEYMQEPENAELMNIAGGSLPTRNDIEPFADNPVLEVFAEALQVARPRAYGAAYAEIADQVVIALQSRMTGAATPRTRSKVAAESIAPLLP